MEAVPKARSAKVRAKVRGDSKRWCGNAVNRRVGEEEDLLSVGLATAAKPASSLTGENIIERRDQPDTSTLPNPSTI
jgi:hypothetical protein